MMDNKLELLIKNRKDLIEVHQRNNMTEGFKRLLTELYPDEAHFIYELLQNAEDMHATEVKFILENNYIQFEHNGTKRDFNIADIDAITSIGNNPQKRDDPTSIGKFGVGFKAVFAYTNSPEIHSGEYHFKIKDYFVPEIEGVPIRKTNGYTLFSFPFDNPKKPKKQAYEEIMKSLEEINENSLLFLRYIKKIEYMLPKGEIGYVERKSSIHSDKTFEIISKHPNQDEEKLSYWLRFQSVIKSEYKEHAISIAYSLSLDERDNSKYRIIPINGKVYIYFPAVKEVSNLKFHINAPFASTVARDSVRNCDENNKIIYKIGKLCEESLKYIKDSGMLTIQFLSVMPIEDDNIPVTYLPIVNSIKSAFKELPYTPVKEGGFDAAKNLLQGPAIIANLFGDADRELISKKNKRWVANAPQINQREDKFLKSLFIEEFGYKAFSQMFIIKEYRIRIESIILSKDENWIKKLYEMLYDTYNRNEFDYFLKQQLKQALKQVKLILTSKGLFVTATETFIVPINVSVPTKNINAVKRTLFDGKDKTSISALNFLTGILEIEEYNAQTVIELKLKDYNKNGVLPSDKYFNDILEFARFNKRDTEFDFSEHKFLLYEEQGKTIKALPSQLMLAKPYVDSCFERVSSILKKKVLWVGYAEAYKEKDLELFVSFCKRLGLEYNAKIIQTRASSYPPHPLWHEKLVHHGRDTKYGINIDYTIENLQELVNLNSIEISKAIWHCVTNYKHNSYYHFSQAQYSPNRQATPNKCESSVVYYLKKYKWIPNRQGVFCSSKELSRDDLRDDFPYNNENRFLAAIDFGLNAKLRQGEVSKVIAEGGINPESEEAKNIAEFAGLPKEKQAELLKAAKETAKLKNNETFSPHDAIRKESKDFKGGSEEQSTETSLIQNIARREKKLEEEFLLGLKTPLEINRRLKYSCLTASKDEKRVVYSFYSGKCQMCDKRIIKHNNQPHFHAINIISTTLLDEKYNSTLKSGWNTISLCPNCAAEYRYSGGKNISILIEQLDKIIIEQDNDSIIDMHILLNGKDRLIKFTPKHLLALQVALRKSKQ